MAHSAIAAALLRAMLVLAPPERLTALPALPGNEETAGERAARYESIASDLAAVAFDSSTPPLYKGPRGREHTASLMLGLAWLESGFAKDVDLGPCYRGRDGRLPRCDGGLSACLMQVRVGAGQTPEGWTRTELFGDRQKCFRAGLGSIRRSFGACAPKLGFDHALDAYASGHCGAGYAEGRERMRAGQRVYDLAFRDGPADAELDG